PLALLFSLAGPARLYDGFGLLERAVIVAVCLPTLLPTGALLSGFAAATSLRYGADLVFGAAAVSALEGALVQMGVQIFAIGLDTYPFGAQSLADGAVLASLIFAINLALTQILRPRLAAALDGVGIPLATPVAEADEVAATPEPAAPAAIEFTDLAAVAPPCRGPDALIGALPCERRGPLLHLQAQNQYVLVRTDAGEALLRMTFREALATVGEGAGLTVHRSHWVAFGAVEGVESAGRRKLLRLIDGTEVPVSRDRLGEVMDRLGPALRQD
ncbi:MAG: LytTR family DNA-binding domain-containing protein, partial [Pseudomonadota bacterium]